MRPDELTALFRFRPIELLVATRLEHRNKAFSLLLAEVSLHNESVSVIILPVDRPGFLWRCGWFGTFHDHYSFMQARNNSTARTRPRRAGGRLAGSKLRGRGPGGKVLSFQCEGGFGPLRATAVLS